MEDIQYPERFLECWPVGRGCGRALKRLLVWYNRDDETGNLLV
jgi:hypothetical protein